MAVKLTGTKEAGGAKIGAVANSVTGEKDGTIPIGDDVIIEGEKIKIQDEAVTLIVRTKYTVGGATLKTVREIRYAYELRAAFQDKTETDRGKRFDINGAKSA